jgi:hypothetical protein
MDIQLVSFKSSLRENSRLRYTADIINSSTSDLILFPGQALPYDIDILFLKDWVENKKTTAVIEVKNDNSSSLNPLYNSLYILQRGVLRSMYTCQLFTDTIDIHAHPDVAEHFILDLETRRKFTVANRKAVVIQCGENGIIRNIQSEGNRAEFRFQNDPKLRKRFDNVLNNTDIILNPIHSPMGNQGKMAKRREYFSANNRSYFSTANFDNADSIKNKSLQYAYVNGVEQEPSDIKVGKRDAYVIRTFVI